MATTLQDIAREAHVSVATVSRALTHQASVAPGTRDRIEQIAQRLGYTPKSVPPGEYHDGVIIGIPAPGTYGLRNPYFAEVIRGAFTAIHRFGHGSVSIEDVTTLMGSRAPMPSPNGMLLVSPDDQTVDADRLATWPPHVIVDCTGPAMSCSVSGDNVAGMSMATEHAILLGHTAIGYVGPNQSQTAQERLQGFVQTIEAHRIHGSTDYLIHTLGASYDEGYQACAQLWMRSPRPTVILAFNDFMAMGVLGYLHEHNVPVPDHVSVIGYDGIPLLPAYRALQLTTVDQHAFEQGYMAANLLLTLLSHRNPVVSKIRVPPNLTIGNTAAHPNVFRLRRARSTTTAVKLSDDKSSRSK